MPKGSVARNAKCTTTTTTTTTTRAASRPPPRFLTIPVELREHIYNELLPYNSSSLFQLLLTNPQITREAKPFIFKQSLIFDGQSELYGWIRRVDRKYFRYVTDIQFKLHDIDPEKIVGALGKRLRQANITAANSARAPEGNPYDEACDREIDRLGNAFLLFPNIKHMTILAGTDADPRPSYHMLVSFSKLLSRRFPQLVTLINQDEYLPIGCLLGMQNLKRLSFPAFSSSSPAEVTAMISGLPKLLHLEFNRLHADTSTSQDNLYSRSATRQQCNYAELTRGLLNLESLAFYGESCEEDGEDNDGDDGDDGDDVDGGDDGGDDDADDDEDDDEDRDGEKAVPEIPEATRLFMGALNGHRSSLKKLKIFPNVDSYYESRVQKKIATFKTSTLTNLEISHACFPGINFLPATLNTLVLWSSERDVPFESSMKNLVITAKEFRSVVPALGNIIIYLEIEEWDGMAQARQWLYERMEAIGIGLRWRRWDGIPTAR